MDMDAVYKQLTSVDIAEQKKLWDERGKGYYGEYLVFCELHKKIFGNSKILMNLNVPTEGSQTTEIDLVMVHETGLYVFEIKHYKGTIYGQDTDEQWTQYFKTTPNCSFRNPMEQNQYHITALEKLFPQIPIHSFVVFTNEDCDVRVTNANKQVDVCQLPFVAEKLKMRFQQRKEKFSVEEIDSVFAKLAVFSKMSETVSIDAEEASFLSWVQPIIRKLKDTQVEFEAKKNDYEKKTQEAIRKAKQEMSLKIDIEREEMKRTKNICIIVCAAIVSVCVVVTVLSVIGT